MRADSAAGSTDPGPSLASAPQRSELRERRREARAERDLRAERDERRRQSTHGVYGDRPPSPFGGVPVSEVAIFAGAVGVVVGLASTASTPLIVGIVVCALGVIEVTAREHFSGYRSHASLLAGIPAVAVGVAMIAAWGSTLARATLLVVVAPVFGLLFWLLRKRFQSARQARIARPPAP